MRVLDDLSFKLYDVLREINTLRTVKVFYPIDEDSLNVGDIILLTTNTIFSRVIRVQHDAPVSHAMVYVGLGKVVEAILDGVVLRSLSEAIEDATVAVALRDPRMTPKKAEQVSKFASDKVGRSYDKWGAVYMTLFRHICSDKKGEDPERCQRWVWIYLGTETDDEWFCSELVLAAYKHAGIPLTTGEPHWASPGDIANLMLNRQLIYVGHLKA